MFNLKNVLIWQIILLMVLYATKQGDLHDEMLEMGDKHEII